MSKKLPRFNPLAPDRPGYCAHCKADWAVGDPRFWDNEIGKPVCPTCAKNPNAITPVSELTNQGADISLKDQQAAISSLKADINGLKAALTGFQKEMRQQITAIADNVKLLKESVQQIKGIYQQAYFNRPAYQIEPSPEPEPDEWQFSIEEGEEEIDYEGDNNE